ncbi:gluconate kinase (SKI family) [Halopolyspora algeriensis]|uniref:Gluconokinase n=1 Tax=Halopolyspora algeriensis TaxID=1500506 RepID=A0A368VT37_9ACTN|nr:gluconokinase [Halopolyspora algeriensis]RCW43146.1 gluconate kinase (SKI family) [Halopolyspora algeriensis]TQM56204.1 gluconate kinase (SKI family) [Halopolyspora algeriensis]
MSIQTMIMGVSGCGKTTVGKLLEERAGLEYAEADEFHLPANIAKMNAGRALTDEDRLPWLRRLAEWMGQRRQAGASTVLACSALKRSYRDILRAHAPDLRVVHLSGSADLIRERMLTRQEHFMPAALLESQLRDLEPLQSDEDGITLDLTLAPESLVRHSIAWLTRQPAEA